MSTATVITLKTAQPARPREVWRLVPNYTREARDAGLQRLGRAWVNLPPDLSDPGERQDAAALICVYAHPDIDADQALVTFAEYVGELERIAGYEPDPRWGEIPPHLEEDAAAALADLLDNTGTYHGSRTTTHGGDQR